MQLPKELTTVTPVSKVVALIMFISLPVIAFFFGMRYQTLITQQKRDGLIIVPTKEPVACTEEAKICPDGSAVGRSGPNCEFEKCPSFNGKIFIGPITSISYDCHMDGICSVGIGKANVIIDKGEGLPDEPRIVGSYPQDLLNEDNKDEYIGKEVEVFAATYQGRSDFYTLFGSEDYYIKLRNDKTAGICGGIAGLQCPSGYRCIITKKYPDASGTCVSTTIRPPYTCPSTEWIDCMPGPGPSKSQCSSGFISWAKANCPNFRGAAY